ncbi:MAG TPA: nuclease-related domain-containing protein [Opitutales bacterium]|nr:nuclease-related domain-containing protein [Opitutales bacterium]
MFSNVSSMVVFEIILGVYSLAFGGIPLLYFKWENQRRPKQPITEKLLRGPGEHAREEFAKLEDKFLDAYAQWIMVFLLFVGLMPILVRLLPSPWQIAALIISAVFLAGWMGRFLFSVYERFQEARNYRLGYFGERLVAEQLDPLRERGYRIFHDVPCTRKGRPFNIDHVVVSRLGIYAIETKTRRKNDHQANRNAPRNVIVYDGEQIALPDWAGTDYLDQAQGNGSWLESHLREELGLNVKVLPILTFPFWWVEGGNSTPNKVLVCNPGQLHGLIPAKPTARLSDRDFDSIVRVLDKLCRKVEY